MDFEWRVFRQGSITYYWSSRFFPKEVREDVFRLYSFVRIVDDCIDGQPQQRQRFEALRKGWHDTAYRGSTGIAVTAGDTADSRIIKNIVYLQQKYDFDSAWVQAFFNSMQYDLDGRQYDTMADTLEYIYGSAEVIGLMMAKVMHLKPEAYEAARMQGRAMQYVNFIRDIGEDNALGRCYFPREALRQANLKDLRLETVQESPRAFTDFVQAQVDQYFAWQSAAQSGYAHLPRAVLVPIKTAADMYGWVARKLAAKPELVFQRLRPAKTRVIAAGVRNLFYFP